MVEPCDNGQVNLCSIDGCERPRSVRGWCKAHHSRFLRHGDPLGGRPSPPKHDGTCTIPDCEKPYLARGYCSKHWARLRRNGDPLLIKPRSATLPGAANSKWQGDNIGYGQAHTRVRIARGKASEHTCAVCGAPARQWAYDHADPDERLAIDHGKPKRYSVKPEHYRPLCSRCHRRDDHGPSPRRVMAAEAMLVECLESLERVGCQFDMCSGPTLTPVDMVTCHVCSLIARIRARQTSKGAGHIADERGVTL